MNVVIYQVGKCKRTNKLNPQWLDLKKKKEVKRQGTKIQKNFKQGQKSIFKDDRARDLTDGLLLGNLVQSFSFTILCSLQK